jgi:hypothetical protein
MSICEKRKKLDVRNIYHKVKKYLALNFDRTRPGSPKTKQMAHIERINWTDSVPDAVAKIAEGNIGAAVCIMDLMKHSEEIDPT